MIFSAFCLREVASGFVGGPFGAGLEMSVLALTAVAAVSVMGCSSSNGDAAEAAAIAFIDDHLQRTKELEIGAGRSWWKANVTGSEEDFKAKEDAENALNQALSDTAAFARLKEIRQQGELQDPVLRRQIEVLYLAYLGKQVDPELLRRMTAKANEVEKIFNTYRAAVGEQRLTENDVRAILKESPDSAEREAAWKASKGVGRKVETILKDLILLRNQAAHELGFRDYYALSLHLNEQNEEELLALFEELGELMREPFLREKAEADRVLAERYSIGTEQLRPWHYEDPFFQEAPRIYDVRLDKLYAGRDLAAISRDFYAGIGLPLDDVLERSSLYEQEGKSPHAFCIDIDRAGDVRILTNIRPNDYWMDTVLHELGHAAYSKYLDPGLPYLLRIESHILTTEAIAMMFGRLPKQPGWLRAALGLEESEAARAGGEARKMLRLASLIFSRWCQVMLHFERELYRDPNQDLSTLWWDLVERYQGVRRPDERHEPDYASKIHLVAAPVYYHNYMMGELLASQIHHAIARELGADDPASLVYAGDPRVGEFLKKKVFGPGRKMGWNELAEFATGEPLGAKNYAEDFVNR